MTDIVSRSAEISPCANYRYLLTRTQLFGHGACVFVMLNPSTADGMRDDPTIRLGLSFEGQPRHPLFLERSRKPQEWT